LLCPPGAIFLPYSKRLYGCCIRLCLFSLRNCGTGFHNMRPKKTKTRDRLLCSRSRGLHRDGLIATRSKK